MASRKACGLPVFLPWNKGFSGSDTKRNGRLNLHRLEALDEDGRGAWWIVASR